MKWLRPVTSRTPPSCVGYLKETKSEDKLTMPALVQLRSFERRKRSSFLVGFEHGEVGTTTLTTDNDTAADWVVWLDLPSPAVSLPGQPSLNAARHAPTSPCPCIKCYIVLYLTI